MNTIVENLTGMDKLTDQVLASDFLISAKTGVKSYAIALTESSTPEVRETLQHQLQEAITLHGKITDYMINKGWYHPYNPMEQINLDMKYSNTALNQA
jgi:similar to spore coat protein